MMLKLTLYKDSDCDLCKLIQEELTNTPPDIDITICHVKHDDTKNKAIELGISEYPCLILEDLDKGIEITRFYGYTTSIIIDEIINKYKRQ